MDHLLNFSKRLGRLEKRAFIECPPVKKLKSLWLSLEDKRRPRISSSVSPSANISVKVFKGQYKSLKRE